MTNHLKTCDLAWAIKRLPDSVRTALMANAGRLFLAGGYIRSIISREEVSDVDLFVPNKEVGKQIADQIAVNANGPNFRLIETKNAFTVVRKPWDIQIIHRWTYEKPVDIIPTFDFTIAMAAIWFEDGQWRSACHDDFYADLAAKRLVYTSPWRNEDAGGSLLRVLKFYQRGYRIPLDSLGAVVARLLNGVHKDNVLFWKEEGLDRDEGPAELEAYRSKILTGLLFEVDPNANLERMSFFPQLEATSEQVEREG